MLASEHACLSAAAMTMLHHLLVPAWIIIWGSSLTEPHLTSSCRASRRFKSREEAINGNSQKAQHWNAHSLRITHRPAAALSAAPAWPLFWQARFHLAALTWMAFKTLLLALHIASHLKSLPPPWQIGHRSWRPGGSGLAAGCWWSLLACPVAGRDRPWTGQQPHWHPEN